MRLSIMSLQRFDVDQLLSWGSRGAGLSDILIRFHCQWISGVQSCRRGGEEELNVQGALTGEDPATG